MDYRTILVELNSDDAGDERLRLARALAGRFGAALIGMHVTPLPTADIAAWAGTGGAYMPPELIELQQKAYDEAKGRAKAAFQRLMAGEGAPTAIWHEAEGVPDHRLADVARTADLVIAGRGRTGTVGELEMVENLVVTAGVPVLLAPAGSVPPTLGRNVLIGWNGSREAARAVRDALPFLRGADRVVLCTIGDTAAASLAGVATMLQRHAVPVEAQRIDRADADAGELLLAQASEQAADLLVMGAYGHSRLRELIFGGATHDILRDAPLPVLFGG